MDLINKLTQFIESFISKIRELIAKIQNSLHEQSSGVLGPDDALTVSK